ncbi:g2443 [Coccomyxa viridis]|uniref:G2443 protein n=1 Tax=Coccomyxa viridis TaxID=1274662 RepID=A0ABP1FP45_9CHLO
MLSGAISVALALAVLLATSHRMVHLGSQGASRVKVRLKTFDHTDPDLAAAEALAAGQPEDIGSYFAVDRVAEGERLMRLAYPEYAARVDNAKESKRKAQLPGSEEAISSQSQDSSDAQQESSGAQADKGQGNADPQQEANGGAQQLKEEDTDAARGESRKAGEHTTTDVSSDNERTEEREQQGSSGTDMDRRRAGLVDVSIGRQQDGGASEVPDRQKMDVKEDGGLGVGIWVIDLTVDDPAALKDGEDTYMVKMWKELEEQRKQEELDPAKEAGSVIIELPGSDPGVQRLKALGAQLRAQSGQPSGMEAAQTGPLQQPKEAEASADKAAASASLSAGDTGGDVDTPLRLVTLFRDKEVYKEPENPKLATWKQDLDRRLLELEEAAAVRRRELEQERAHLFPHIPLVEGILDKALEPGTAVKGLFRPAAAEDLLDGAELEQRLRDEGRLDDILRDPGLMPNWEVQLQMQQAS